jgi:hypothetical protein
MTIRADWWLNYVLTGLNYVLIGLKISLFDTNTCPLQIQFHVWWVWLHTILNLDFNIHSI